MDELTISSLNAIAYHLEQGQDNGGITRDALAILLRDTAQDKPSMGVLLRQWQVICGAIIATGEMATKTKCEDALMSFYGVDRVRAHDVTNTAESINLRPWPPTEKARNLAVIWATELFGVKK